jgi:hypothetical protein
MLMIHSFWAATNPQLAMMQQAMFMKNLSMLGRPFSLPTSAEAS